jgi:hypothetical protein
MTSHAQGQVVYLCCHTKPDLVMKPGAGFGPLNLHQMIGTAPAGNYTVEWLSDVQGRRRPLVLDRRKWTVAA